MKRAATLVIVAVACGCSPDPLPRPAKTAPSHAPVPASWAPPERTPPSGDLTPEAFERYSAVRAAEIGRCWAGTSAEPPVRRMLTARLTVLPSGLLEDVEVAPLDAPRDDLASCVTAVLRSWRTPFRPAGPVGIEVPITVAPER